MTVQLFMDSEKSRGGQGKNKHVTTVQRLLPISVGQFLEKVYNYVKIWKPEDLQISAQGTIDAEEAK